MSSLSPAALKGLYYGDVAGITVKTVTKYPRLPTKFSHIAKRKIPNEFSKGRTNHNTFLAAFPRHYGRA